ncbi:MAG: chemotaxis protein CheW [Proteobacteria bacterium]|nr:chemotaxis protein CheW [Pseudomonadota bacterium]
MPSKKNLILIFTLNDCKYAVEIAYLIEVVEDIRISSNSDLDECLGLIQFRENAIPLFNIKSRLELDDNVKKAYTVVVIRACDELIAIPIDSVNVVEELADSILEFPDIILKNKGIISYIYEWKDEFVYVFNLDLLLGKVISELKAQRQS